MPPRCGQSLRAPPCCCALLSMHHCLSWAFLAPPLMVRTVTPCSGSPYALAPENPNSSPAASGSWFKEDLFLYVAIRQLVKPLEPARGCPA